MSTSNYNIRENQYKVEDEKSIIFSKDTSPGVVRKSVN